MSPKEAKYVAMWGLLESSLNAILVSKKRKTTICNLLPHIVLKAMIVQKCDHVTCAAKFYCHKSQKEEGTSEDWKAISFLLLFFLCQYLLLYIFFLTYKPQIWLCAHPLSGSRESKGP